MPIDIISPYVGAPSRSRPFTSPNWSWMAKQEYSPERAWHQTMSSTRRGTLSGGPSLSRFLEMGNEQAWTVIKPRPVLTQQVLTSDEQAYYKRQFGALDWNSIDPLASAAQMANQGELLFGKDNNPLDFLRGVEPFLHEKGIELFGQGNTGVPARAADYALALPIAVWNKLYGKSPLNDIAGSMQGITAGQGTGSQVYRFQGDPRYWHTLGSATPGDLDVYARELVAAYSDPDRNAYMVSQIRAQFDIDKNAYLGLASGNPSVDYQAYKLAGQMARDPGFSTEAFMAGGYTMPSFSIGAGFPKIPLIGTQIAETIDPVTAYERDAWRSLPPDVRRKVLGDFGMTQMATDFIGALPALSGLGTVLSVAKGGTGAARTLYQAYDWTMRAAGWTMSAGLTAATVNWGLEAAWPGYSEFMGEEVDRSRPISGSYLAGTVNAIGYFASGTYGTYGVAKVAARGIKGTAKVTAAGIERAGLPHPSMGTPEAPIYMLHGGARMSDTLVNAGLDSTGLAQSQRRLQLSYGQKIAGSKDLTVFDAVADGRQTGIEFIDNLPTEQRMELANDGLRASMASNSHVTEMMFRIINLARQPASLFRSEEARVNHEWAKGQARTIENDIAQRYAAEYGPAWVMRTTGGPMSEASMRDWVRGAMERVGGDYAAIEGVKGEDRWLQIMRTVYHYEFDYRNGELDAAFRALSADEAGKLTMVSSRHLFDDMAPEMAAGLRSDDPAVVRATLDRLIDHTIEGERWFTEEWKPGKPGTKVEHSRENVPAGAMADWIDDVRAGLLSRRHQAGPDSPHVGDPINAFHARLARDGQWELAFKPVDEAGDFISYIRTRNGKVFQSPFMDYPMSSADNIELGNRGLLGSKMDAIFRGFRTWRVMEFQKASLFRNLSGQFNFSPAQIEEFHAGIQQIARKYGVQGQSVGAVAQGLAGLGHAMEDDVSYLVHQVFGDGPWLARDGTRKMVDWRKEIARSYRQSLRLNFTAGLTSHLKSRFGPIGSGAAYASDIMYVNARFNLSPLFKVGEVEESLQLNVMRGVNPAGDPWVEALMYRGGIGDDYGALTENLTTDQMLAGMDKMRRQQVDLSPADRAAASYIFHASHLGQTLDDAMARQALAQRAEEYTARVQGGWSIYADRRHQLETELASLVDDEGNILPGMDDRAGDLVRVLTGTLNDDDIRAANHVGVELPNEQWSLDPMDLTDRATNNWRRDELMDPEMLAEERGLWHTTTATDSVHESGLMSRAERVALGDSKVGLGPPMAGQLDRRVSLTTDYNHAEVIAARLRLAVESAHDTATGKEIIDHFYGPYADLVGEEEARAVLGARIVDIISSVAPRRMPRTPKELESLETIIDVGFGGKGKYLLVQSLDDGLQSLNPLLIHEDAPVFESINRAGLTGSYEDILKVDPAQIGIVQVGVKKGASWRAGTDRFEMQMDSKDIWTMDQRQLAEPFATDRDGLQQQLQQTLREDGTPIESMGAYREGIIERLRAIDQEANPDPQVDRIEDIVGTPENLTEAVNAHVEQAIPGWRSRLAEEAKTKAGQAWATGKNPVPFKVHQASLLEIDLMKRDFPQLLAVSGQDGLIEVLRGLNIPETEWAPFMIHDRELAAAFHETGSPEDLQALIEWAGPDARAPFDELYASEEWATITGLWAINAKTAADTAFTVHFFNPYRSAFERSLNHPLTGVYPLSWAYKAAREWARFLYDNRMFGDGALRLGMSPAVALANITQAQNEAFAQSNEQSLEQYLGRNGPFGSTFFIFNLMLPGDWSNIPFPLTRTLRDALRGEADVRNLVDRSVDFGLKRDVRLGLEMLGEVNDFVWGPQQDAPDKPWSPKRQPGGQGFVPNPDRRRINDQGAPLR